MTGGSRGRQSRSQRLRNWVRGMWPDHNVLRRASDRAEAAIVAALLAAFLAGAPLTGMAAWQWAAGAGARPAQPAARYQVRAVLLGNAPYQDYTWYATAAPARWSGPDGRQHTGEVSAPMGARKGSTVRIWTDRSGRLTGAPLRPGQAASQALLAALLAPLALGFVLLSAGALARGWLQQRRLAAWAADWRITGPQWSHQR